MSKITGLSLDTLRAWERRYQAVVPQRSHRGRQYDVENIERFKLLRELVLQGHAIGGIASLADQSLKELLAQPPRLSPPGPWHEILRPMLSAIENFDAARAADELSRLAAILMPREMVYQVALPLMREVGTRYHNGTLAIAQEHLVSELLRNLLGSMMRLFRLSQAPMKVLLATPAGEAHAFGTLAAAMLASIAGSEPVYLGPNLPAQEIVNAARRVSARIILLGITLIHETTAAEVRHIAAEMPPDAELWIGGPGVPELDRENLGSRTVVINDLPAFEDACRARLAHA